MGEVNLTSGAPVVDSTGGQGDAGAEGAADAGEKEGAAAAEGDGGAQAGQYGGFDTPELLAADHAVKVNELTALNTQVKNLESIKGRHGNEIGTLRNQIATLTGQIEGMKVAKPEAPAGPTIDDIAKQLEDGDIDEAKAIKMAHQAATQEVETKLGQKFQTMFDTKIGEIQKAADQEKYVAQFMKDNPGYSEAYESGKLDKWINGGVPGEEAWDKFQLETTKAELQSLKSTAEAAALAAGKAGLDKGIKIEQGKTAAGKVLTGKGGQFSATTGKHDLADFNQRRQAGIERLAQLRSG